MGFFEFFKKKIKCIYVNGTITVTLLNKSQLIFTNQTPEEFEILQKLCKEGKDTTIEQAYDSWLEITSEKTNKTLSEVIQIKQQKKKVELSKQEEIKTEILIANTIGDKFKILINTGEFREEDTQLFLGLIPLSIPLLLASKLITSFSLSTQGDKDAALEFESLKNFWRWCSLNPNSESRENLFKYIVNHGLKVNKYGFFVTYRRIQKTVSISESKEVNTTTQKIDPDLSEFVSNAFTKIKGQKKSTKNFDIWYNNTTLEKIVVKLDIFPTDKEGNTFTKVGNLFVLYDTFFNNSSTEVTKTETIEVQHYTDAHTKTMDIKIGQEVSIDPKKCDWDNSNECSNGLHCCSKEGYGCGDTQIMCLINPIDLCGLVK